jgi:hypothetical protein
VFTSRRTENVIFNRSAVLPKGKKYLVKMLLKEFVSCNSAQIPKQVSFQFYPKKYVSVTGGATQQGCQVAYFKTRIPIWVNFGGL